MPVKVKILICLLFLSGSFCSCGKKETQKGQEVVYQNQAPSAPKKNFSTEIHGISLFDEYHWLKEETNPEVIAYLKKENAYLDSILKKNELLKAKILTELRARLIPKEELVHAEKNFEYYVRQNPDQPHPIYFRKEANTGTEKVILDFNHFHSKSIPVSIAYFLVSPDQQYVAFAEKSSDDNEFDLIIRSINNQNNADTIPGVSGSAAWAEDNLTIFYTTSDEAGRADKVYNHKLFLPYEEDKLVYIEEDPEFQLSVSKSQSHQYIIIHAESHNTSETHILSADDPNQDTRLFSSRKPGTKYAVFPHINSFYILEKSNGEEARLMRASAGATDRKNWHLVEAGSADGIIEGLSVFSNYLVLFKSISGLKKAIVKELSSNTTREIPFDETLGHFAPLAASAFNSNLLYFTYESLISPPAIYEYNLKDGNYKVVHKEIIAGYKPEDYISKTVTVQSKDGIDVPVSLVYKKDLDQNKTSPLFLFAYGAYGRAAFPLEYASLSLSNRLSLLDRGFIFAIAHVRGGGELGKAWHEEGKLHKKTNSAYDYIACAEYLIKEKYTAPEKLIAIGKDEGALTIATAANMQPSLFKVIVADNPKVDLIHTALEEESADFSLQFKEFGDPRDEELLNTLLAYSPYDNIEVKEYPDFYITNDINKPLFYEGAKWAARLREYNRGKSIIVSRTIFHAPQTTENQLKEISTQYTFILRSLGIGEEAGAPLAERK